MVLRFVFAAVVLIIAVWGLQLTRMPAVSKPPPTPAPTLINSVDHAEMVYIPPGSFLMGDDDRTDNPRRTVTLSGYYIYKNLVTVRQYKAYIAANPRKPSFDPSWSQDDHPMVNVTWQDAMDYAKWAGGTLPTEAQWERAARGTDGWQYPWGDEFDAAKIWSSADGRKGGTTAVGHYGISSSGCTDMAGNVWQWCRDWYDADFWKTEAGKGPDPDNQTEGEREYRVLRGGSWSYDDPLFFRSAYRNVFHPSNFLSILYPSSRYDFGFRCVVPKTVVRVATD
jgi:formylglycine-generating enzyme required for sulfatase activity